MVFNSVPHSNSHQRQSQHQTQTPIANISMASSTFSAKSQPLHNFSLTDLKWSMNHATSPHRIRSHKSPQRAADADHSPIRNAESEPAKVMEDHHHRHDHDRPSLKNYHSLTSSDGKILAGCSRRRIREKKKKEKVVLVVVVVVVVLVMMVSVAFRLRKPWRQCMQRILEIGKEIEGKRTGDGVNLRESCRWSDGVELRRLDNSSMTT